ncbi:nucleoside 2-deoxyribosyltransferase [Thiomonas delicata]|jgi:nucleoside 2-deoxyribosyltransferase|uniref:Putative nucleoside 2-deoxyribosyltransferase n=1 Tax=Thiomonas delicata TaxID=364030 RepID=A0A238D2H7_THIDL|nr:nucleoside 2-deoxyribosyltransferase [Thiomonas delicata]SBP87487.1 putative nucleoside 2-deoxyribosyltransferase [Thiomonas delicata]
MTTPRVYLAGPDLFFEDRDARYARLRAACAHAGLEAVTPTDGLEVHTEGPLPLAEQIYQHNLHQLRTCDAVLVNLSPFRGVEPDSGSVFEAAFALATGKPVAGWIGDAWSTTQRRAVLRKVWRDADGRVRDKTDGGLVEDFGLPVNLMLACSFAVMPTPWHAIDRLAELLGVELRANGVLESHA